MFKRMTALALIAILAGPVAGQTKANESKAVQAAPRQAQPIPRTTFRANMDKEFSQMDIDRDGSLTKKEIEQFQTSQIVAAAQARKRALFAAMDTDHNGVLSQDEFMRLPSNERAPNGAAMLQRFDTNRDGKISLIEYRAGTLVNFDRLDADKDGVVTPAEMKAAGLTPR